MAEAQQIARAGPSKIASCRFSMRSISRPRNPLDLFRDVRVQTAQPFRPTLWSKALDALFYTDHSRYEHSRQHSIRLDPVPDASQKLFHLVENCILIANKRKMIVAGRALRCLPAHPTAFA